MPFCTSCGADISADENFCTSCGAPVDKSDDQKTPQSPLPVQPGQSEKPGLSKKTLLVMSIVALLLIVAVAYGVFPLLKGPSPQQPQMTPVPLTTVSVVTTSIQPSPVSSVPPPTVTPRQVLEARYGESYEQVYTLNRNFAFGQKEVFSHVLTQPPLYIKFNLTPVMVTRQKVIDIGLSSEKTINATYPSPNAWFEVKVLDAGNGAVVSKQGFNKEYSVMTKQEFMVRNPGNYKIELSGNDVVAEVQILTGIS